MRTAKGARIILTLFLAVGGLFLAWSVRKLPDWLPSRARQRDAAASKETRSTRFFPKDPKGAVAEEERARNPNILIPIPSDNPPPRLPKEFPMRWEFVEPTSREGSSEAPPPSAMKESSTRRERLHPTSHKSVSPSGKVGSSWQGEPGTAWREAPQTPRKGKDLVPVRAPRR